MFHVLPKRIFLRWMATGLMALMLGTVMNCRNTDNSDDTLLLALLYVYLNRDPAPVQLYVDRAATALNAWNINLQTGVSANSRSTDTNYVMSPNNWITVANSLCQARGVPASWQGSTCNLSNGVIGICITRYYTSGNVGELIDTTLVMLDTFQADSTQTEATKQSVFTHEVGHCLGLRHAETGGAPKCGLAYTNCIMYPSTAGADTPHASELSAIDAAYTPAAAPDTTSLQRFSQTGGVAVRHWSDPTFTVSSVIGSAMLDENAIQQPPAGAPLSGSVEIRVHKYYQDGSETVSIHKQQSTQGLK